MSDFGGMFEMSCEPLCDLEHLRSGLLKSDWATEIDILNIGNTTYLLVTLNIESETVVDENDEKQEGESQEDIFLSLEDLGETGELGLNWSNPHVLQQPILMDDVYMGDSEPEHIVVEEDQLDEKQKLFLNMEDLCENHDDTLDWSSEEMGDIEEV